MIFELLIAHESNKNWQCVLEKRYLVPDFDLLGRKAIFYPKKSIDSTLRKCFTHAKLSFYHLHVCIYMATKRGANVAIFISFYDRFLRAARKSATEKQCPKETSCTVWQFWTVWALFHSESQHRVVISCQSQMSFSLINRNRCVDHQKMPTKVVLNQIGKDFSPVNHHLQKWLNKCAPRPSDT